MSDTVDTVELEGPLECQIQLSWREHWSVKYSSVRGSTGVVELEGAGVLNTVHLEGALEVNPSSVRYS